MRVCEDMSSARLRCSTGMLCISWYTGWGLRLEAESLRHAASFWAQ